jgi:biopolymer transport protein ExbB
MSELVIFKGGWVMVPILVLSVYALAIIFYKLYQFYSLKVFSVGFVAPVMQLLKREAYPEAISLLSTQKTPLARVMQTATQLVTNRNFKRETKEAELMRIGAGELRRMESHLRGLEMTYTAAPLLGLLGTVLGMVSAFSKLAAVGSRVDPSILAGGIWEALITTVAGLIVAVPALMAYYWFDSVVERMRANMQDTSTQIMSLDEMIAQQEMQMEASAETSALVDEVSQEMPQDQEAVLAQEEAPITPAQPEIGNRNMAPPKSHYAKPAQAVRSKASMRKASRNKHLSAHAKPANNKSNGSAKSNGNGAHNGDKTTHETTQSMSLFSINQPKPYEAPKKPATKAKSGMSKPAQPVEKAASTLHLLSPTYTKF